MENNNENVASRYFKVFYSYNTTSDYYGVLRGKGTLSAEQTDGSFFDPKTTLTYLLSSECTITVDGEEQEVLYSNWRIDKIEELTESEYINTPKGNVRTRD